MSALALVERSRLDELAAEIRREHAACSESALTMLYHGIAAGEALIAAQREIPRGGWQDWLTANLDIAHTTVSSYMRVAEHKEYLLAQPDVYTMQTALQKLQDSSLTTHSRPLDLCREIGDYAKKNGPQAAARDYGVSYGTAQRYSKGIFPETREERAIRRKFQSDERKRRKERRAVAKVVRGKAPAASELYAAAERMQDLLAAAVEEAETAKAKAGLKRAGEHYRAMRDEIVTAILGGGK